MSNVAMIFPGQGSQTLGMLADYQQQSSIYQQTLAQASEVLGYDVATLIKEGPLERLNQTELTQPILLTVSVALWQVWRDLGGAMPSYFAGHSLGEYSALTCAGCFSFTDALRLVVARAQAMQVAVPEGVGAMLAIIGLDDERVVELCEESSEDQILAAANYNAPGQVVVAGHQTAVDRLLPKAKAAGAKLVKQLAMSVPSHCLLMETAAAALAPLLQAIECHPPVCPVLSNVDAKAQTDPAIIKQALLQQLYHPVRWTQSMQALLKQGMKLFVECGPGQVLTGLGKRIERGVTWSNFASFDKMQTLAADDALKL